MTFHDLDFDIFENNSSYLHTWHLHALQSALTLNVAVQSFSN